MVTSPIAPPATPGLSQNPRYAAFRLRDTAAGAGIVLDAWHLLSLDAPTVAVVWSCAFAWSVHARVPWLSTAMLAVATWLLYVADRLLDGLRNSNDAALQHRHHFHIRHRIGFIVSAAPGVLLLAWFVWRRMDAAPRSEDFLLGSCALLYLLCVHLPICRRAGFPGLPKELAVGAIFAAACVIPTWSREPSARPALLGPAILLGALCWLNCVAIEHWERPVVVRVPQTGSTYWVGGHLRGAFLLLAGIAAGVGLIPGSNGWLSLSVAISTLFMLWLHEKRRYLAPLRLRAAADAVLLTPILFLAAKAGATFLHFFIHGH